jgi:hypothetical protein
LDAVTIFVLAVYYERQNWGYQFVIKNLFNSYDEIGDVGGARPLPREGLTLELAAIHSY